MRCVYVPILLLACQVQSEYYFGFVSLTNCIFIMIEKYLTQSQIRGLHQIYQELGLLTYAVPVAQLCPTLATL